MNFSIADMRAIIATYSGKTIPAEHKKEDLVEMINQLDIPVRMVNLEVKKLDIKNQSRIKNIYHISDIHIRNVERYEEYIQVFKNLLLYLESVEAGLVVVSGDVLHNPSQISPQAIKLLLNLFKYIAKLHPVIVFPGNHDVMKNYKSMDILDSLIGKIDNIFYISKSGRYSMEEFDIDLYSITDFGHYFYDPDKPVRPTIALYHGSNSRVITKIKDKGYMFGLLGDIHSRKIWKNERTLFGYPGSLIQQNFGETTDKGIIVWNISNREATFVDIPNKYKFLFAKNVDDLKLADKLTYLRMDASLQPINVEYNTLDVVSNSVKEIKTLPNTDYSHEYMTFSLNSIDLQYCYGITSFNTQLSKGVTILRGDNGRGKSSIVRGVEFALFCEKKGMAYVSNYAGKYDITLGIDDFTMKRSILTGKCNYKMACPSTKLTGMTTSERQLLRTILISSTDYQDFEHMSSRDQISIFGALDAWTTTIRKNIVTPSLTVDEIKYNDLFNYLTKYYNDNKNVEKLEAPQVCDYPAIFEKITYSGPFEDPIEPTDDSYGAMFKYILDKYYKAYLTQKEQLDQYGKREETIQYVAIAKSRLEQMKYIFPPNNNDEKNSQNYKLISDVQTTISTDFTSYANEFYSNLNFNFEVKFRDGLYVKYNGRDIDPKALSKSEKIILALGIKVSLYRLAPMKFDTLFIDETLDCISSDEMANKIFTELNKHYKKIIVITHREYNSDNSILL